MTRQRTWMGATAIAVAVGCTPQDTVEDAPTTPQTEAQQVAEAEPFALAELFTSEG